MKIKILTKILKRNNKIKVNNFFFKYLIFKLFIIKLIRILSMSNKKVNLFNFKIILIFKFYFYIQKL